MRICGTSSPNQPKCFIEKIITKRDQKLADREQELLTIAESIMEREGFAGLTMDKVVAACSFSKGTVYNHFSSKEDLVTALCVKGMKRFRTLSQKASMFEGNSREKSLAMHYAYQLHARQDPTLFLCVLTAKTPAVKEKSSPERIRQQEAIEIEVTQLCDNLFDEAVKAGDLKLAPGIGIASFSFANWAMSFGTNALISTAQSAKGISRLDINLALLHNISLLQDGMGWKPLASEWDYLATWHRIEEEVFAEEVAALSA